MLDLEGFLNGGVSQVTDRNRSVSFRSPQYLDARLALLRAEDQVCMGLGWPRRRMRVYYVPQVKDL